jgi:hypothetical protein
LRPAVRSAGRPAARPRSRLWPAAASAALAVPLLVAPATTAPAAAAGYQPGIRQISYEQWTTQRQFRQGRFAGTEVVRGTLQLADPVATRRFRDHHGEPATSGRYDLGRWVSPWRRPGYAFDELIPSWDALTPGGSWIKVQVRGRSETGQRSRWYTMANWAEGDHAFHRASGPRQADDLAEVAVDTLRTRYSVGFEAWQVRLVLLRPTGSDQVPQVETVGAMTSALPRADRVRVSRPGVAGGVVLDVPRYSQMIHDGDYPEYDGGGEAWCSPTSVSMVLGSLDALPGPRAYRWVERGHPNRFVDHAARSQYDHAYDGAGNWSFSAAYAAGHADAAFVTRLRHLREAERFIRAGIPLVASVAFGPGELTGAPIGSTAGHLMVIIGFTEQGDVVVNDPAAPRNRHVQRVYDRREFETAWLTGSGGLVYVIRDGDQRLPHGRAANW